MGSPFGVELPENLGQNSADTTNLGTSDLAPGTAASDNAPDASADTNFKEVSKSETTRDILDLDKLERFRFGGRELTPKELKAATLRLEDYTRKTQEVAETRKYAENFVYDLQKIVKNPNLLSEMKRIYPAQYVKAAEEILRSRKAEIASPQAKPQQHNSQPTADPRLEELLQWKQSQESHQYQMTVQKYQADFDRQFDSLSKKYPGADPEVVNSRAIVLSERNTEITPKVLEALFKQHNDQMVERDNNRLKTRVDEQRKANAQGRGVGAGGGTPGSAPIKAKNLKEAKARMLADIEAGRLSK
jgi:hypothetical protein